MAEAQTQSGGRIFALVACRIMALYILFNLLARMTSLAAFAIQMHIQTESPDLKARNVMTMDLSIQGVTYLLGFTILWFAAPWLAAKMVPERIDDTLSFNLTAKDLASLAVSAIGLYCLAVGFLDLMHESVRFMSGTHTFPVFSIPISIAFLGACAIFLKYRHQIANFMVRSRSS